MNIDGSNIFGAIVIGSFVLGFFALIPLSFFLRKSDPKLAGLGLVTVILWVLFGLMIPTLPLIWNGFIG